MGMFQLGQVFSALLSKMIISAFTTSVAYDILPSQLKDLFGIPVPRYSGPFKSFYVSSCSSPSTAAVNVMLMSITSTAGCGMHKVDDGRGGGKGREGQRKG